MGKLDGVIREAKGRTSSIRNIWKSDILSNAQIASLYTQSADAENELADYTATGFVFDVAEVIITAGIGALAKLPKEAPRAARILKAVIDGWDGVSKIDLANKALNKALDPLPNTDIKVSIKGHLAYQLGTSRDFYVNLTSLFSSAPQAVTQANIARLDSDIRSVNPANEIGHWLWHGGSLADARTQLILTISQNKGEIYQSNLIKRVLAMLDAGIVELRKKNS